MRAFAITGIVTVSWISRTLSGSAIRATPPSARRSAGTRSSAITATAPASSAIFACSAVVTSMITPPFNISARPPLTRIVPSSAIEAILARCLGFARRIGGDESARDRDRLRVESNPEAKGGERQFGNKRFHGRPCELAARLGGQRVEPGVTKEQGARDRGDDRDIVGGANERDDGRGDRQRDPDVEAGPDDVP